MKQLSFSSFSCMFLIPNIFFQIELYIIVLIYQILEQVKKIILLPEIVVNFKKISRSLEVFFSQ